MRAIVIEKFGGPDRLVEVGLTPKELDTTRDPHHGTRFIRGEEKETPT